MAEAADVVPTFQGSHGSVTASDTAAPEGAAVIVPTFQGSHGSGDDGDTPAREGAPHGTRASGFAWVRRREHAVRPTGRSGVV